MSTKELKKQVYDSLESFEYEIILAEIYRLLQSNSSRIKNYNFNESQSKILDAREAEIKSGVFLTEEEADKEAEKWLKK